MKKAIQEEVSRVKELMGILNEQPVNIPQGNRIQNQISGFFGGKKKIESIVNPIDGKVYITSPYGPRWGRTHHGIDIRANSGTNIKAVSDGTIIHASFDGGNCGGFLKIQHDGFESVFCHIKKFNVKVGDKVSQGEILALSGGGPEDPGRGKTTGPHVHYELYVDGKEVNPENYLSDAEKTEEYHKKESVESESYLDDILNKEINGKRVGDWIDSGKLKLTGLASVLKDKTKNQKSIKERAKEIYDDLMKSTIDGKSIEDYLKIEESPKAIFKVDEIRREFPCLSKPGTSQLYLNPNDDIPVSGSKVLTSGDILYYREFWAKFKNPSAPLVNVPIIFDKVDGKIVGEYKEDGKSVSC